MENINESISRALQSGRPNLPPAGQTTARDCMVTSLVTFKEEQTAREVIRLLLSRRISGGPVLGSDGQLVGMVSEMDFLRSIASGSYDNEPFQSVRLVRDVMTRDCITVGPRADVYKMAQLFEQHSIRRLPVVDEGRLVGQVSRRDVLAKIERSY